MKRIIYSLFVIFTVLAMVAGSTLAFYLDIEKSEGNTFSAGEIDLKVDSESHYNDMICVDNYWYDPNEEELECDPNYYGYSDDGVESGIDRECIDMGFAFGIAKWEWNECLHKYIAEGDPNYTYVWGDDLFVYWKAKYYVDGIIRKANGDWDVFPGGFKGIVEADEHAISHITFCGDEQDLCGNCVLDEGEECDGPDSTPEGYICTPECKLKPKLPCYGTWELTDLIDGVHKFFYFTGIKPSDKGEDTISLHVYDNDAFGKLLISDIETLENGCSEPELEDEPACEFSEEGELREKMKFTLWLDQGTKPGFQNSGDDPYHTLCCNYCYDPYEGDNIRQCGEPILFQGEIFDPAGEEYDFSEILKQAYTKYCKYYPADGQNDHKVCHGIAKDGRLVAGTTYYFGLSWEFPGEPNNETQSDIFNFDMILDIEQHRHNND